MNPRKEILIRSFIGSSIQPYLNSIARLRLEVFRDFPYLYESTLENEIAVVQAHIRCPDAIAVLVFDGSTVVGVSTGIPAEQKEAEFQKVLADHEIAPARAFYFSESVLLKQYRGRGVGHHFYDLREEHVKNLKTYDSICFFTVPRANNDPERPADYLPLSEFWTKRGYVLYPHVEWHHKTLWIKKIKSLDERTREIQKDEALQPSK